MVLTMFRVRSALLAPDSTPSPSGASFLKIEEWECSDDPGHYFGGRSYVRSRSVRSSDSRQRCADSTPWRISPVVMTIKKVIVECDLPAGNTSMLDFYREESAARSATQPDEVDLLVPTPRLGSVSGLSGREYIPDAEGIIRVLRDDARPLKRAGYVEVKVAWRAGFVSD